MEIVNTNPLLSYCALIVGLTIAVAGCTGAPETVPAKTAVKAPVSVKPAPRKKIEQTVRKLKALERRLASLDRKINISAQRSLENRSLIEDFSAKLADLEKKKVVAPPPAIAKSEEITPFTEKLSQDELYLSAYRKHMAAGYTESIQRFVKYMADYPDSRLADNALFWIGEGYYKHRDIPKAIGNLSKLIQDYPNANRVPYALYRLALIYYEQKEYSASQAKFITLMDRFPKSEPAGLAAVKIKKLEFKSEQN